jgi:Tfp pilus assembly protein PilN
MSAELTNLLPESRIRAFRKRYFFRLATLALLVLSFLIVLHGLLLIPTYLFVHEETTRGRAQLSMLQAAAQTSEEKELTARTTLLKEKIGSLTHLEESTSASAALKAVLAVPRPGVRLTGFMFTAPQQAGQPARMQVIGVALSRDSLRTYATSLGALPFVTSADLPISAYAKESDIDFTVTLSGSLKP